MNQRWLIRPRGRAAILLSALVWSTGGVTIKLCSWTAAQIVFGRAFSATLVLWVWLKRPPFRRNGSFVAGSLSYAATTFLFIFANKLTTAGNAIFLQNLAPVWVMMLGPLILGERATRRELWSVPISVMGCLLFFVGDLSLQYRTGNIIATLASICYALMIISFRKLSFRDSLSASFYGNVIIMLIVLMMGITPISFAPMDVAAVIYLGAFEQVGATVLFLLGIMEVSALEGSLLLLFEPVLSPLWCFLLLGERMTIGAIVGATLIITATLWRVATARRSRKGDSTAAIP